MKKLTKIVATIGPVTDTGEMIENLIHAGVNIFRFNFKHNTVEWHGERMQRVREVAKKMDLPIGILLDLQGPEIRIRMSGEHIEIKKGDVLLFGPETLKESDEKGFSISHPEIIQHLKEGQKLLADDGSFTFFVEKKGKKTYLRSDTTGILKMNKSLNIPGADFPFPVLTPRDFEGLQLAADHDIDYVALSFVRSAEDIRKVRTEAKNKKVKSMIVAKIETKKAINDLDKIIQSTDAVMIARGDLGVELPIEEVPHYQKVIITKCMADSKPVITATQMLQSMVTNPYPTRAEVSDVANAVYDQTDSVMLSAESATGSYPLQAVEMMARTLAYHEKKRVEEYKHKFHFPVKHVDAMLSDAAYNLYNQYVKAHQQVAGFVVFTQSGRTARFLSRYRPKVPIFAFTPDEIICRSLTINYGVVPFVQGGPHGEQVRKEDTKKALRHLIQQKCVERGDLLIVLHGDIWGLEGKTSTIRIVNC